MSLRLGGGSGSEIDTRDSLIAQGECGAWNASLLLKETCGTTIRRRWTRANLCGDEERMVREVQGQLV